MSKFFFERLKYLHIKKMSQNMPFPEGMEGPPMPQASRGDTIQIDYCPKCHGKLKNYQISVTDKDILCDFCDNKKICKVYDKLKDAKEELNVMEFDCQYFLPDRKITNESGK